MFDYFELSDFKEKSDRVEIYFEEKNIHPKEYATDNLESKGFSARIGRALKGAAVKAGIYRGTGRKSGTRRGYKSINKGGIRNMGKNWFSVDPKEHLDGKVSIVTGGGTGIGAACAETLAAAGAKIVVAARRKEKLESTVSSIREAGGEAIAVSADVTKQEDIDKITRSVSAG